VDIAFVSGNPHLPQVIGGVEVNTHELAGELIRRGNRVWVVAKLSLRNGSGLWRAARTGVLRRNFSVDRELGYPVFRSRRPWQLTNEVPRPAVAVVQNGAMLDYAAAFARVGVPSVAYLHGLGFEGWDKAGPSVSLPFRGYIANSRFTAERFRHRYGLDTVVIPPLFRRERYVTQAGGPMVTFINPVPVKGTELALDIAERCPDIPFCFVRAWPLGVREAARLRRRLRRLGNIQLRDRTADMRSVYRDTRILLVPSQWEDETWGRVASEAQFSGIPVVASNRGGLPEAVGPGGIILGYDQPATVWADALRELWSDARRYSELSEAALRHASRPDLRPNRQVDLLVETLERLTA
jgi:glycosyltransferase involved in cell wall biosynthesis